MRSGGRGGRRAGAGAGVRVSAAGEAESRVSNRTAETRASVVFTLLLERENTFFTQAFPSNHTGDTKQRLSTRDRAARTLLWCSLRTRARSGERPSPATLHHPVPPVLSLLTTRCSSSLSCFLSFSLNRMRGQGLDSVPFCTRSTQNGTRPLGGAQRKDHSRGSCGDSHLPMSCWHLARCALSSTSSSCSD